MKIVGDMAIKDLTPQSTNIGDRIVKNLRICGSGIYTYAKREAHLLGLTPIPEKYKDIQFINVYRPPEVLNKYKDYFARVPIITGHHVRVDRDNAKELTVGMVGDTVQSEVDEADGETYLYTTGTIVAGDGVEAYEKYGQLSVGYDPEMKWEDGEHNGVPYQAVLTGFKDVNHLLICKVARGGPQCMVMDSLDELSPLERFNNQHGGKDMKIFEKIFGSTKKKALTGDETAVSILLQSIAVGADPKIQVQKVKDIVGDSDETFTGYLDELSQAQGEKPEVISKAVEIVDAYYKNNMMGDEDKKPENEKEAGDEDKKPEDKKPEDKKSKDEKEAGDEDKKPENKKSEDKKEVGDQKACGDSIDYDVLADKVAERLLAKQSKESAGDEKTEDELSMPINNKQNGESFSSDSLMKDIWG